MSEHDEFKVVCGGTRIKLGLSGKTQRRSLQWTGKLFKLKKDQLARNSDIFGSRMMGNFISANIGPKNKEPNISGDRQMVSTKIALF